jgi:poly(A) polymerase
MEPSYPFAIQSQDADDALALNREMEEYLSSRGDIYEKADGQINRREVIDKLTAIMVEWAGSIGRGKGIDEAVCQSGGGIHLRIFGSTRLGVHTPDADVDVLCVAPSFVLRSDFFNSFCLAMKNRVDVSMLSAVPEAYTPVVKFNIDGQAVDMIFVSLALTSIPSDLDILDSRHLKGLDEQGIRSLNGSRVAEWICRLVPNFSNFATALRFVKHWARQRGLYSNVLGFLGGVNYAILVAFVCQKYPYACAATIVRKFFQTYNQWRWPEPIMLVPTVEDPDPSETEGLYLPVWNPKVFPKDGLHAMPIITPAYPAMNSSYNVGVPQLRLIQDEITRGLIMFQQHRSGGGEKEPPFPWRSLCSPAVVDFFTRHPRYIQIDISAYSADDHRSWFGWCESRLRLLILALEQPPLTFCHPQANCFHRRLPLPPQQHPPNVPAFDLSGGVGGGAVAGDRISRSLSDGDLVHACSSSSGAGGSSSSSSSSCSSSSSAGSGNHGVRSGSAPRVGVSDAATSTTPSSSPGGSGSPVTTSDGSGCHDSGAAESAAQASSSVSVESKRGDPSVSFAPLPSVAGGT